MLHFTLESQAVPTLWVNGQTPSSQKSTLNVGRFRSTNLIGSIFIVAYGTGTSPSIADGIRTTVLTKSLLQVGKQPNPHHAGATRSIDHACYVGKIQFIGGVDEQHAVGLARE